MAVRLKGGKGDGTYGRFASYKYNSSSTIIIPSPKVEMVQFGESIEHGIRQVEIFQRWEKSFMLKSKYFKYLFLQRRIYLVDAYSFLVKNTSHDCVYVWVWVSRSSLVTWPWCGRRPHLSTHAAFAWPKKKTRHGSLASMQPLTPPPRHDPHRRRREAIRPFRKLPLPAAAID
ncbi:hypothetical protein MUK42_37723 [Musa troglodytarum]|uniref:Uncharacterized protein n=1 Tax=Musa troglodytarum TaxID=320322 RepID=A0A9E7JAS5_9LILI|nr:hypothetical protein MUK42_37723 [Musa troglodytarum]